MVNGDEIEVKPKALTHIATVYPEHCGCITGLQHTNAKDITCPQCLKNMKEAEPPMQIDEYLTHYKAFYDEFLPNATVREIEKKILAEMQELNDEITIPFLQTPENKISECIDVMNMSIKLLTAYGVKNVLHAGYMKLQETAAKYRGANNA